MRPNFPSSAERAKKPVHVRGDGQDTSGLGDKALRNVAPPPALAVGPGSGTRNVAPLALPGSEIWALGVASRKRRHLAMAGGPGPIRRSGRPTPEVGLAGY
jgi:hypothetical protein